MFDRRRSFPPPRDRPRSLLVAVLVVAVVAPLAVAGWARFDRPSASSAAAAGRFDPNVVRTAPVPPPDPVVTTVPAAEPPATPTAPELVTVAGSKLRRGVARPVSSPATVADVKIPKIGLYSAPGQA